MVMGKLDVSEIRVGARVRQRTNALRHVLFHIFLI
jgi:hypothetical protein